MLALWLLIVTGCSSSAIQAETKEKPVNSEQAVKGPYEIAAEQNIPSVVSYQAPTDSLRFIATF